MGVKVEADENRYLIHFDGELTIYTVAEYRQAILEACEWDRNIEVYLSEVGEIDTAGLQLLASLHRQVMSGGNKLECIDASEVTKEAFELSRFSDLVNCENIGSMS